MRRWSADEVRQHEALVTPANNIRKVVYNELSQIRLSKLGGKVPLGIALLQGISQPQLLHRPCCKHNQPPARSVFAPFAPATSQRSAATTCNPPPPHASRATCPVK